MPLVGEAEAAQGVLRGATRTPCYPVGRSAGQGTAEFIHRMPRVVPWGEARIHPQPTFGANLKQTM
jgi:hypothetical protein